ncbi:hypothetical protein [Brucella anthropi]|uniref:hypothetical protein n=1 Tax=Brucella anthropi TaxID=529 RepID=UPI003D965C68
MKGDEIIYRLVVSPGDIDPNTGKVLLEAIRDVKHDGLSVIRSVATDQEIEDLVRERLTIKPGGALRVVEAILEIKVSDLQSLVRENWGRLFCVYDETVPRKYSDLPPVPTHATLLQRVPPAKTAGRNGQMKDDQKKLYDNLVGNRIDIDSFRNGLIKQLNQRSLDGEFQLSS